MFEKEIEDAINQLQAGSTSASADLKRLALSPSCTPEQYHQITSAIYAVLDDVHLESSKRDNNLPLQQATCLTNLAPVLVEGLASHSGQRTHATLACHWANLRQWILYLKNDFVDRESVDLPFRLLAKKSIVDILGICDDFFLRHLFDNIVLSSGMIATLVSLWHLETRDNRFALLDDPSTHSVCYTPGILDSWMCTFSNRESWEWSQILLPFGGDADALATTALHHLKQDIARTPINYDLIVWDIHLITTLSVNEHIRMPLLNQQSMTLIATVINSLVLRYGTTNKPSLIAKCLSYGYWYIRAYVESTEGLPWVTQVVEAGLVCAMLCTQPWLKHLNGEDSEDWEPLFLLLGQIIPEYSIYSSVLRPMSKQLKAIDASGLAGKLNKNGMLFDAWSTFEGVVRGRAVLYKSAISNETHIESCQNEKCDKSGPPGSFKSCAGCLHVHYCSKECQVYDWRNGGHQKYCRDIQARRAAGLLSRLSKRDVRFIDRVIAQDLQRFRDRIQDTNSNPVVVELDYTEIPIEIAVGTIYTIPPIQTCQCDAPMTQKWNHMIEIAQKSTSSKILVRALLPGGTSERVKLQCLPLKRMLGDGTPANDEDPMSEFDETFDLLYSRAGQSYGIVDAAFPNEAMRAMKEKVVTQGGKV